MDVVVDTLFVVVPYRILVHSPLIHHFTYLLLVVSCILELSLVVYCLYISSSLSVIIHGSISCS